MSNADIITLLNVLPVKSRVAVELILAIVAMGGEWKESKLKLAGKIGASYRRTSDLIGQLEKQGIIESGKQKYATAPATLRLTVKWKENNG